MRSGVVFAAAALLATGAAGCLEAITGHCTDELRVALSPRDTVVTVGSQFTAKVALSSCGGSKRLEDEVTWTSSAPEVVQVDARTGRVTAVGPGEAHVHGTGTRYGPVAAVAVEVRATP